MALTQVTGPYPIFTDLDGSPLDDGYLYIGAANQDPETNPIQVFWDSTLTIPATQPIRTNNGYAWRNGTPGLLYTAGEFSITIRNKRNEFVLYSPLGYGFDPKAASASVVKNDFTGDGVETDFTLSASPSTILATNIFINGVYQEKDSYSLVGNVITFSIAPPLGSSIEILTNETGVINGGNANDISYTLTAPGAVGQTVQTKLEQYVSVIDFGAIDDNATDNTAAIQAAAAYIQSLGGGTLIFPFTDTGIYCVQPTLGTIIADFTDLEGVTITFQGTTLKDTQSYPSVGNQNTAFRFTRCNRVRVDARFESELIVTAPNPTIRGLIALRFDDKCVDVDVNVIMVGGRNALWFVRDPSTQDKAYNIRAMIDASNCLYPYAATFSGDDAKIQMRADTCGRNFFIYGVDNNWIDVTGRNQMVSCLIDNSGGGPTAIGCRNIWVNYYDRDSDNAAGAPLIELVFRVAATTYENINVNLDVYCPATRPFDTSFRIVNVGGITGNTLDGLRITGRSEHSNALALGTAHVAQNFNWDVTDTVRNVLIENFTGTGTNTAFGINLQALDGPTATFVNVSSDTTLGAVNGTSGSVTYIGCTAAGASNSTDTHTYINCNWIDPGSQNKTNKTFFNTFIGTDKITSASSLGLVDGVSAPATVSGIANLFVDTTDGDLKIRFGDGTVKTIVVDT